MDEHQAQEEAVALCGRRLMRRRRALKAGCLVLVVACLTAAALPPASLSEGFVLAALVLTAAGLLLHGRRFPAFADAYRDLGLDPLSPTELERVHQLLDAQPGLGPAAALLAGHEGMLRKRDLAELEAMARLQRRPADQHR